jgi:hypothetical protein
VHGRMPSLGWDCGSRPLTRASIASDHESESQVGFDSKRLTMHDCGTEGAKIPDL